MDYTIAVGGSKGELFIWQLEENPNFCNRYGLNFEGNKVKKLNSLFFINFYFYFFYRMILNLKISKRKRKLMIK